MITDIKLFLLHLWTFLKVVVWAGFTRYWWNQLLLLDQAVNCILGPLLNLIFDPVATARFGDPTERLSSVFGKNIEVGACKGCKLICKVLNWIQPNHCIDSIQPYAGADADENS